jgi:hypothetical protein
MALEQNTAPVAEADDAIDGQDIFYVCQKALVSLKQKLKEGEEVFQELVNELTYPEKLADEEIMVPVDMRGVEEEFDDVESMVEKLGPKGAAEAFVKARDYFEANKDKEPADERPQPMTAAEWKKVLEDDFDESEEEDLLEDDEEELEEELEGLDDEEGEEEAAEAAEEPAAKKPKTE